MLLQKTSGGGGGGGVRGGARHEVELAWRGLGFGVWGLGFGVWGFGFWVLGFGFWVWVLWSEFGDWGLRFMILVHLAVVCLSHIGGPRGGGREVSGSTLLQKHSGGRGAKHCDKL